MKLINLLAAGIVGASLLPAAAFAGTQSGFYLGAGAGQSSVGDIDTAELGQISFSGNATAFKVFGGYNFGVIPLVDLAVEGGYVDFGSPDDTVEGTAVKIKAHGYDMFGLVGVNLGPVGLFGKVGGVRWYADLTAGAQSASESGTDAAYGAGLRFKFSSLELRAEYEYFNVSEANNLSLVSASAVWTF